MANPIKTTAIACGFCGKLYHDNGHHDEFAEACCRCTKCGVAAPVYTGQGMQCSRCHMIEVLARYREQLVRATADLAELEAKAKAMGIT